MDFHGSRPRGMAVWAGLGQVGLASHVGCTPFSDLPFGFPSSHPRQWATIVLVQVLYHLPDLTLGACVFLHKRGGKMQGAQWVAASLALLGPSL